MNPQERICAIIVQSKLDTILNTNKNIYSARFNLYNVLFISKRQFYRHVILCGACFDTLLRIQGRNALYYHSLGETWVRQVAVWVAPCIVALPIEMRSFPMSNRQLLAHDQLTLVINDCKCISYLLKQVLRVIYSFHLRTINYFIYTSDNELFI